MKTLIAAILVTLLAGCSGMPMHSESSGGGRSATGGASSSYESDYHRMDDTFHSWIS